LEYNSVAKDLASMHKGLGSIPSTSKKNQSRKKEVLLPLLTIAVHRTL
jgi:hypothetical protein